jgi:hypothetical protein
MGRKPEAGGAKDKRTDPEQSARFIEAARQVGVDETGDAFERAFDKITGTKKPVSFHDHRTPSQQSGKERK